MSEWTNHPGLMQSIITDEWLERQAIEPDLISSIGVRLMYMNDEGVGEKPMYGIIITEHVPRTADGEYDLDDPVAMLAAAKAYMMPMGAALELAVDIVRTARRAGVDFEMFDGEVGE